MHLIALLYLSAITGLVCFGIYWWWAIAKYRDWPHRRVSRLGYNHIVTKLNLFIASMGLLVYIALFCWLTSNLSYLIGTLSYWY